MLWIDWTKHTLNDRQSWSDAHSDCWSWFQDSSHLQRRQYLNTCHPPELQATGESPCQRDCHGFAAASINTDPWADPGLWCLAICFHHRTVSLNDQVLKYTCIAQAALAKLIRFTRQHLTIFADGVLTRKQSHDFLMQKIAFSTLQARIDFLAVRRRWFCLHLSWCSTYFKLRNAMTCPRITMLFGYRRRSRWILKLVHLHPSWSQCWLSFFLFPLRSLQRPGLKANTTLSCWYHHLYCELLWIHSKIWKSNMHVFQESLP